MSPTSRGSRAGTRQRRTRSGGRVRARRIVAGPVLAGPVLAGPVLAGPVLLAVGAVGLPPAAASVSVAAPADDVVVTQGPSSLVAGAAGAAGDDGGAASRATPGATGKVVLGRAAAPQRWAPVAALLQASEPDAASARFCGGTLVAPSWVLTAAHCLSSRDPRVPPTPAASVQVSVGAADLDDVGPARRLEVVGVVLHPDHDPTSLEDDLALLRLRTPSPAPLQRLALPGQEPLWVDGAPAAVAGWGSTTFETESPSYPRVLREATVPVVDDARCAALLDSDELPEGAVCAGAGTTTQRAADTCGGDSGGPLVVADPRGYDRQLGVTSFGPTCGATPTVYAGVPAHLPWVETTTGRDANTFPDTGSSVHEASVERAAMLGVAGGLPDGTFRPADGLPREQAASLLARAAGVQPTAADASGGFPDVGPTHRAAVNALARLGVVRGTADGTFRPRDPVRRDQMASLTARTLQLPPLPGWSAPDVATGSTHAAAIGSLVRAGVVAGYPDGRFRPDVAVTRGQAASLLARSLLADGAVGPAPR